MIPTLKKVIDFNGELIDMDEYGISIRVYDDILLMKSLNDMNKHQMIERVSFIQKNIDSDFDYLLQDSLFRTINKQYNNLNMMTLMNTKKNNFKHHPFVNEEQLQSILAIKNNEFLPLNNSLIKSSYLKEIDKTHKKLSRGLNNRLAKSIKSGEYIHVGNKASHDKLQQLWLYLYGEIDSYNLTNQLISYVSLELEYAWAFLNELFYLIDQYVKSVYDLKKSINEFKSSIKQFVNQYVEYLLLNLRLPNVRLYIIREIVDECEKEKNSRKKMKMIENRIKRYDFVRGQHRRFKDALKILLKTTISIETNALKNKLDYYKEYYIPRDKTQCENIEFSVSLFFEAIEEFKQKSE